jgi:hypothetical protein
MSDEKQTARVNTDVKEAQAPQVRDPLAIHHLSRLLAGANDIDRDLIEMAFPDLSLDAAEPEVARARVRAYLEERPELAQAVLAADPSAPPPRPQPKTRWTTLELLAAEFPEPRWAVPGLVPEGLGILAGRPKVGKSWLALQVACAVGTGGMVLGQRTQPGKALYIALEDSPRRLQGRMKLQLWPHDANVVFETIWPDLAQDGGLVALQSAIERDCYTFVVVDTISRAARFDQIKDPTESTAVMGNLQRLANEYQATILLIDHHAKRAGYANDVVDDVLGSTGKTAVADAILGLYKERGKMGATLNVTGRDLEECSLTIQWDGLTCTWQLLGEAGEVARQQGHQAVLQALADVGGKSTTTEIAHHLDKDKGQVSRWIADLVNDGKVIRGKKDGRSGPYHLPDYEEGEG